MIPSLPQLRPYQERAYRELQETGRALLRDKPGCGVLGVGPTGCGKTRIALEVARGAIKQGRQVLWLAPRMELIDQPALKLAEYGWYATRLIKAGRVEGDPTAPLTIASIQTLVARQYCPPADVVVLDEARHYVAKEWGKIAGAYRNAIRIGLDATPARADGSSLGDLFDVILPISSVRELTSLGYLVPSVIYAPAEYQRELAGWPLDKWRELGRGPAVVFCQTISHARQCVAAFLGAGISAELVTGASDVLHRRSALHRFRTGVTKVLCNCMLFTEGLDVPEIGTVIIARGVSSEATWLQICGRALRPCTGKTEARIIDLRGHVHLYGMLDDERTWHLDGKPIRHIEGLPTVVQCKSCHSWHRGGGRPCPVCGAPLPEPKPPRVKAKDLQEYRAREAEPLRLEKLKGWVRREMNAGRSPYRAGHIYRGVYGVAPLPNVLRQVIKEATYGPSE